MTQWKHITGPRECHGVTSPEAYLALQRAHLTRLQRAGVAPAIAPHERDGRGLQLVVSAGRWVVVCDCGNAPSASHEWDLACCLDCGAIYRGLPWPADREAIEQALVTRPMGARNWAVPETVEDLRAENVMEVR